MATSTQSTFSKQNLARFNRWTGWILIPAIILSVVVAYPRGNPILVVDGGNQGTVYWTIQGIVIVLPFVHFLLTLYLFGMPRFSNNRRTVHIYLGYATFLIIFISQSLVGLEPWFIITNIIMYIFIIAHIVLGVQSYMERRASKTDKMAALHRGQAQ